MYYGRFSHEKQRWIIEWPNFSTLVTAQKRSVGVEEVTRQGEQVRPQPVENSDKVLETAAAD